MVDDSTDRTAFGLSKAKLEDSEFYLNEMREAADAKAYRRAFLACILNIRAITHVLGTEGRRRLRRPAYRHMLGEFTDWRRSKEQAIHSDPLLARVRTIRNADLKEGDHPLAAPGGLSVAVVGVNEAGEEFEVSSWRPVMFLVDPPASHLGEPVDHPGPEGLCEAAIEWHQQLLDEAARLFPYD